MTALVEVSRPLAVEGGRWRWVVETTPPPVCGASRGARGRLRCELPPDHTVGRLPHPPVREEWHLGRDRGGRWRSWAP